ncbi:MAG: hypothetical protein GWP91_15965 [Rhodobacterales bacterium]|nr:hypothetical protein [Rhodobacterales bacterium]
MHRFLPLFLLLSCQGSPKDDPVNDGVCGTTEARSFVINELFFGRIDEPGVGPGFDLDGLVSEAGDGDGCNKPDLTTASGTPGVDSAFAGLVPILEATEAAAVEGLIHDAIRLGDLLLLFEISGLDSEESDECVQVDVVRASGDPLLGTDGNLLDYQTFARHAEIPPGVVATAYVEDGVLWGSDLDMAFELQVLDEYLDFHLERGQIRLEFAEDGSAFGEFAGVVSVAQILAEFDLDDIGVADLIATAVPVAADIYNPDTNTCDWISITFRFEAVPSFIME